MTHQCPHRAVLEAFADRLIALGIPAKELQTPVFSEAVKKGLVIAVRRHGSRKGWYAAPPEATLAMLNFMMGIV